MARPRRSSGRATSSMPIPQTLNPAKPKAITPPASDAAPDVAPDAPVSMAAGPESPITADRASSPTRSTSSSPTVNSSTSAPPSTQTPPSSAPSKSPSPPPCIRFKPKVFRAPDGTAFEAWAASDRPDAPILGEEPKRSSDGTTKPRTKRQAEDELEFQWQKKRKLTVVERVFKRLESCVTSSKSDHDGNFHFEGEPLPDWLNAEREFQDDGSPGTYIVRPNKEDFENRFEEIISILEPFGMKLGVVKLKIPEECIDKAPPVPVASTYVPPPPAPPPTKRKRGRPPKPKTYADPKKSIATETPGVPGSSETTAAAAPEPVPQLPPDPLVYTMTQFLPLHVNSKHQYAPVFEVISKNQRLVPISQFPHSLSESTPNLRIPEDAMFMRGRSWEDIKQDNPGGEVYYSSDNDVTPELRAHLGLQDPKLTKLPGNHIFDSTESVIGIHTPYLYLGNPYTMFALHQEDYCALSFNYHHKGAPKMWRVTCPLDFEKVERLVARIGDEAPGEKLCSQHVRHASLFVSQGAFELEGVRSMLVRQKMGEMIITWPLSYHEGWNEGANICEAVAYGSETWRDTFVEEGDTLYRSCGRRCVQRGMGLPIQLKFKKGGDAAAATTKEDGN